MSSEFFRVALECGGRDDPTGGPESDNPVFLRQRERVTDMMRKAGVPEG
jgi:hypothetical protein